MASSSFFISICMYQYRPFNVVTSFPFFKYYPNWAVRWYRRSCWPAWYPDSWSKHHSYIPTLADLVLKLFPRAFSIVSLFFTSFPNPTPTLPSLSTSVAKFYLLLQTQVIHLFLPVDFPCGPHHPPSDKRIRSIHPTLIHCRISLLTVLDPSTLLLSSNIILHPVTVLDPSTLLRSITVDTCKLLPIHSPIDPTPIHCRIYLLTLLEPSTHLQSIDVIYHQVTVLDPSTIYFNSSPFFIAHQPRPISPSSIHRRKSPPSNGNTSIGYTLIHPCICLGTVGDTSTPLLSFDVILSIPNISDPSTLLPSNATDLTIIYPNNVLSSFWWTIWRVTVTFGPVSVRSAIRTILLCFQF